MYRALSSSAFGGASRADEGYRRLAARVIERAFRDLAGGDSSGSERADARAFLAGSPMLDHWCQLAGLDPKRLVVYAKQPAVRRRFLRRRPRTDDGDDAGRPMPMPDATRS
jgi:hypothetical protein